MATLSDLEPKPNRMGGMGLVEFIANVHDRREKFMHLTTKGSRLWRDIRRDIQEEAPRSPKGSLREVRLSIRGVSSHGHSTNLQR